MATPPWRRWFRRPLPPGRAGRRLPARPSVEALEGRCLPATFTVTTVADGGPGSLRQAILDVDAGPGGDTINFNIPGGGVQVISPASALPVVTKPVFINATTQPGFIGQPRVALNGTSAGATDVMGLWFTGGNSRVQGLDIYGFSRSGIFLQSNGNVVQGDYVGTDSSGTVAIPNGLDGVEVTGNANLVGGTTLGAGNVISGNMAYGVDLFSGAAGNVVQGNYIGTDFSGTRALGNHFSGVGIALNANNNVVGGSIGAARNLISGNGSGSTGDGISVFSGAFGNIIQGNYIGTDSSGTVALPNNLSGIGLSANGNAVGANVPGAGNLISGNQLYGVDLFQSASGNLLQGNRIGTDASGTVALGNHFSGVGISETAAGNIIGGTTPAARNLISGNGSGSLGDGISIFGSASANVVEGNFIGTDASGTRALANRVNGVGVQSPNNTVGGTASGAGNVIAGNLNYGLILGGAATGNVIQANAIGTDVSGTQALPNGTGGVGLFGVGNNTVGGAALGTGNVIAGNAGYGVLLSGTDATANVVQDNAIGTNASASQALPNGTGGVGLFAGAHDNTIGGLGGGTRNIISGNGLYGVLMANAGTSGNVVEGNLIGTDAGGSQAIGNGATGVTLSDNCSDNTVGGAAAGAGNLISGNRTYGVEVFLNASNNRVQANAIGTDVSGRQPLGNGNGVGVYSGAHDNTIGGYGNIISGNQNYGVVLFGTGTANNVVQLNAIGTDGSGTQPVGNGLAGVGLLSGASFNQIGGAGARNIISANQMDGVLISDNGTANNLVQGNFIGTDVATTNPLGNGRNGVAIVANAGLNAVGGVDPGAGNVIGFNSADGVLVDGGTGNAIRRNAIFQDGNLGIELTNGGNNEEPAPTVTSAVSDGTSTVITGTLASLPGTSFALDFFANQVCNPSGFGEGERFLGTTSVSTDSGGNGSFVIVTAAVDPGQFITATATDPNDNTSGFSACIAVTGPAAPQAGAAMVPGPSAPAGPDSAPLASDPGLSVNRVDEFFSTRGRTAAPPTATWVRPPSPPTDQVPGGQGLDAITAGTETVFPGGVPA